jgi:ATP-dependent RNA helicase DDX1
MVKSKHLDLSQVRFFVLDEADRLTEPENMSQIMQLYNACPVGGTGDNRLQVCFFSATLHSEAIVNLSNKLCFQPVWVDLKGVDSVPETVHHVVYKVTPEKDFGLLSSAKVRAVTDFVHPQGQSNSKSKPTGNQEESSLLIKELKPQILVKIVDHFKMSQCIVFCRTNLDCDNLETFLNAYGGGEKFSGVADSGKLNPYSCCVLGGMRSTQERRRNLEAFREGAVRFLICTDVAARGIDIQGLPFVINMTLPDESEHYIHRIGRVGRADLMGLAISIVADEGVQEKVWYHSCANRGKGCTNRQLKSQGGCTIWYNEGALLSDVCQRLHVGSIPSLQEDFSLPPELAEKQVEYGEDSIEKMDVVKVDELHHYQTLGPTVKELAAMEFEAQNIFLKFAHGQTD